MPVEPGPPPRPGGDPAIGAGRDRSLDEVEVAVLARSAVRSRAEMRQMLIAEFQSLNWPVPDDGILLICGLSRSRLCLSLFHRMPVRSRC